VFTGLNLYLGNYIGQFLGELCLATFFLLSGLSLLAERRWLGWCGMAFGFLFLVGALRNVLPSVQPAADVNNALLPLWLLVLGVSLVWSCRYGKPESDARQTVAADAPQAGRR
jgi:hypothetical protein